MPAVEDLAIDASDSQLCTKKNNRLGLSKDDGVNVVCFRTCVVASILAVSIHRNQQMDFLVL